MSSFTDARWEPARLSDGRPKKRGGRQVYRIKGADGDGFYYEIGYRGSGLRVHVKEDFETDGPSIPGVVRWLVPPSVIEKSLKSAAVHDKLREDDRFTPLECDCVFLMAMQAEGTPNYWREQFFRAVRTNNSRARANPDDQLGDVFG